MKLIINGNETVFKEKLTIEELLKQMNYQGDFFAVAINMVCIPRSQFHATYVKDQDHIEILMPMQGG